jgi:APA family basic amino acid/polyamine antiporter
VFLKEKITPHSRPGPLRRLLSSADAAALGIGIVIGTGIFAVPGPVARELGAPGPILLVWLLGGVIALAGALTFAEVGSLFPRQGGSFVYVLEAYGPFAAFLQGWGAFLVGYPASSAGIATVLGIYLAEACGWSTAAVKPAAIGAAALVWALNLRGTRFSATLQTTVTTAKVGALAVLAVLALASGSAVWERLAAGWSAPWPGPGVFAVALVGVLWTYDGWQNLTVVAGEVGLPEKSLVRGLLLTIAIVTSIYLLLNVGYLVLLPVAELAQSESAASAAAAAVVGEAGGRLIAVLVVVSSFGALFGIAVAAPRFAYALGHSGLFFRAAARLTPDTQAPRWGVTALFLLTTLYVLTGSFLQIVSYYVAITLIYNVLSVAAVYPLRRKLRERPRPFRVPGYPFVPALFIVAALWVTANEIARNPGRNGIGVLVLLAAAPVYRVWRRRWGGRDPHEQ